MTWLGGLACTALSCVTLGIGFVLGHYNANEAIRAERDRADTLEAERDSLQTRYMALLNKEASPCQSK